jgi:hypothetical protein
MTSGIIDESADSPVKKLLKFQGTGIWKGDLADMRRDSLPSVTACGNGDSGRPSDKDHATEKPPRVK